MDEASVGNTDKNYRRQSHDIDYYQVVVLIQSEQIQGSLQSVERLRQQSVVPRSSLSKSYAHQPARNANEDWIHIALHFNRPILGGIKDAPCAFEQQ
jgi:hypothetical protein